MEVKAHGNLQDLASAVGVSVQRASEVAKADRLPRSVKKVGGRYQVDVAEAVKEWDEAIAHNHRPTPVGQMSDDQRTRLADAIGVSKARAAKAQAELLELELKTKQGELVRVSTVRRHVGNMIIAARTKLLGVPSRAKSRLPHLKHTDVTVLDDLVRESLEDLGKWEDTEVEGEE